MTVVRQLGAREELHIKSQEYRRAIGRLFAHFCSIKLTGRRHTQMNRFSSSPKCKRLPMLLSANTRGWPYLALTFLSFLLIACDQEKPMSNTLKYRSAHGIVEGQANTIFIGQSRIVIPQGTVFDVYTSGDIRPNQADRLHLYINMASALGVDPERASSAKLDRYVVRAEVTGREKFSSENGMFFYERALSEPNVRKNMGLIEYTRSLSPPSEHSGIYLYKSIEESPVGLFPQHTEIHCSLAWPHDETKTNGLCRASYYIPNLVVQTFFDYSLLPHWRLVLNEVDERLSQYQKM